MSSGLPSDEVAEDYKHSLEDLTHNDKYQITNLTVIAKENTEHAMAISRVLENHIRNVPAPRKLPALYVLDSIVKNVGTPYTLFLGRNLYNTYMTSYTLVDSQIRRKLDEMLKTWKEPVPGSLDTRPVFPPEVTRTIESALLKARTAALQQQQARGQPDTFSRGRPVAPQPTPWRNTPTPPQNGPRYQLLSNQNTPSQYGTNGFSQYENHQLPPQKQYPPRFSSQPQAPHTYPPPLPSQQASPYHPLVDVPTLHRDIENLIVTAKDSFAQNPMDEGRQTQLKALLDLQNILRSKEVPQDQLRLIRDQVTQLQAIPPPFPQLTPQSAPPPAPVLSTPSIYSEPQQAPQLNPTPLLTSNALAELIKSTANRQQPTPPPQPGFHSYQQSQVVSTPPRVQSLPAPAAAENPLIASLRAQGLLPPASSTPQPAPSLPAKVNLPFSLQGAAVVPTPPLPQVSQSVTLSEMRFDVKMTSASVKISRPYLISTLYEAKPNRCGTCGRRFLANEEGREKKARHLDWHFKTNQRIAEAIKKGQHRSWYVDERDWIKSREYEDDNGPTNMQTSNGSLDPNSAKKPPQWIVAPDDPVLRNTPCPICQEKFESTWSDEAQDWIWKDAVKVGNRIYHASCYEEVVKDGARVGTPVPRNATGTPDSVLGKRKAEDGETNGLKARIKTEPAAS